MEANKQLQRTLEAQGFITVARAAALLPGVRPKTIYGWASSAPPAVRSRRIGGLLFVHRGDVVRELGIKEAG
jgi:hypothetical protein